ncbi:phosphotransferase enzyme family protein [Olivibacter sitiensis]|uniref:phosphotransferase enzyme family protein n=1 Tax=Olivibacter sitiensis TaxID=376470 RepID=UPI0004280D8F|nr:aminoglycoside phosphotransferase family protein [Olivibacter sitiensis]
MNRSIDGLSKALDIFNCFEVNEKVVAVRSFGNGHINDTFFVETENTSSPNFLLQRINHHVFQDIGAVTQNIYIVTNHLRQKLEEQGYSKMEITRKVLTPIPAQDGSFSIKSVDGDYWRLYYFIDGTKSYEIVENEKQAYEGGKAFGEFQSMLVDLDSSLLLDVIPNFHNLEFRYQQLQDAISANRDGRLAEVEEELTFVDTHLDSMLTVVKWGREGMLPLRITHNDTKFNNVLLDQEDKVQCIVDLDTVMPGYVAYDFGDAVRTIINTAAEDEADHSKIGLNLSLFDAFAKGFLEYTADKLTEWEKRSLLEGVLLLPFIMGVRFLTDYLNGDVYYKVAFEKHNLQRARAQFVLVKLLQSSEAQLKTIIEDAVDQRQLRKGDSLFSK